MKQFCKKIILLLVMVVAGTSIAMQKVVLQVEALTEALEALEKSPQGKKLSKDVEKKIQDIVAYINEAYVDKFLKFEQEKPLETLLSSKTWGLLPQGTQLVIANQLIKDAVDYINQLMIPHTIKARTVGFNHDGSEIVSGGSDGTVNIWNAKTYKLIQTLEHGSLVKTMDEYGSLVKIVVFSPDGSKIASVGFDGTVNIWNAKTYKLIQTLEHGSSVNSVVFSSDGSKIVSGGPDGTVKLWNVDNGKFLNHSWTWTQEELYQDSQSAMIEHNLAFC